MERKEIVKRLSEHLCVKARYLGPPNFDYEIKIRKALLSNLEGSGAFRKVQEEEGINEG